MSVDAKAQRKLPFNLMPTSLNGVPVLFLLRREPILPRRVQQLC